MSQVEKTKYIERFKTLYEMKKGTTISDEMALEYFEKLVCLVGAVTGHLKVGEIILPKEYGRRHVAKA